MCFVNLGYQLKLIWSQHCLQNLKKAYYPEYEGKSHIFFEYLELFTAQPSASQKSQYIWW